MLAESKDDFPKCLYLDQNKWIDLARAHYGRDDGKKFEGALRAVTSAVSSGRLIVPFSSVNAIEAIIDGDEARRDRLARFMVDLSGNWTILPEDASCRFEIANAVARIFGNRSKMSARSNCVKLGIAHSLGMGFVAAGQESAIEPLVECMDSAAFTMQFLKNAASERGKIVASRVGESGAVSLFKDDRAQLSELSLEQRRKAELIGLFFGCGTYRAALEAALQQVRHTMPEFRARVNSEQNAVRFLSYIPNLDVLLTLRTARDRDKDHGIKDNDIRDLDGLSVAVPYCNVVVTENYWGHQVRVTKLDKKYDTAILTNLQQLPEALRLIGCVARSST